MTATTIEIDLETADQMWTVTGHVEIPYSDPRYHAGPPPPMTVVIDAVDELYEVPGEHAWGNPSAVDGDALAAFEREHGAACREKIMDRFETLAEHAAERAAER